MAGTKIGGQKAAATNIRKYGADFYKINGQIGGRNGHNGGFGSKKVGKDGLTGKQRASKVGVIGGRISKRRPAEEELFEPINTEEPFFELNRGFVAKLSRRFKRRNSNG